MNYQQNMPAKIGSDPILAGTKAVKYAFIITEILWQSAFKSYIYCM